MNLHFRFTMNFQKIFNKLSALTLFFLSASVYPDVCVWRNPERTMKKIFPQASDYKTITKIISEDKRKFIEGKLKEKLTEDESKDWIYYEITGKRGQNLGYILADAEKGEYGVIEIVMGITPDGKIEGIYIQRSSEKDKYFKSEEFLKQFYGKNIKDPFEIGKDLETVAVKAVILAVRKMLIFYDELATVITKLEDILKNPANYKDKDVILEGIYEGKCCATDFFYRENEEVIEIRGFSPSSIKKGDRIRVYAGVKVVDKRVIIEAKAVEEKLNIKERN